MPGRLGVEILPGVGERLQYRGETGHPSVLRLCVKGDSHELDTISRVQTDTWEAAPTAVWHVKSMSWNGFPPVGARRLEGWWKPYPIGWSDSVGRGKTAGTASGR
jgi:hypothetical protein